MRGRPAIAILGVAIGLIAAPTASAAVSFHAASADGSRVIFDSDEQLALTDEDTNLDIYERSGGATTQISQGQTNGNGPGAISFSGVSADAAHVFFTTEEVLATADVNSVSDVYQRFNATTALVSGGSASFGGSWSGVSADGSSAYFQSFDTLVPEDDDNDLDLYERADFTNTNLVTACADPCANTNNVIPTFGGASTDGSRAFFFTVEPILGADTDDDFDVYERSGGQTHLVSQGEINGNGNFDSFMFGHSPDGTLVLFSTSEQLVNEDDDMDLDIYQRLGGETTLVTPGTAEGFETNDASEDATRVFGQTTEPILAADDDNEHDVYEFAGGTPTLLTQGEPACQPDCGNGEFEALLSEASADGQHLFFETEEKLASTDTDAALDLYDSSGGVTTHVSRGQINGNSDAFEAAFVGAASDGAPAFFQTEEQLVGTDNDAADDIYQRSGGVTTLVSRGQINGNGNHGVGFLAASSDGSRVIFGTGEQLTTADNDIEGDIYERSAGTTKLVSVEGIAPQTSLGSGPSGTTADSTPTFTFSSDEAGTFACSVDGGGFVGCSSPRTVGPLGNGSHTFRVRAIDLGGNVDPTPASRSFTVNAPAPADSDPPETTIDASPKAKTKSRNATFEFSADEAGATFECSLDGGSSAPCSSPFAQKVKRKRHTFEVVATDPAGNADPTAAEFGWKVKKKKPS